MPQHRRDLLVDIQSARRIEVNLPAGVHDPVDDLVHGVIQRRGSLAAVRQQPIPLRTDAGRVFELLFYQQGPTFPGDRRTPDLIDPGGMAMRR